MNDPAAPHPATTLKGTGAPEVVVVGAMPAGTGLLGTARMLGGRIDTRDIAGDPQIAALAAPLGLTFVFRFGVVVTIGGSSAAIPTGELDAALLGHVIEPGEGGEAESVAITAGSDLGDRIGPQGQVLLVDASADRLLLAATVLARSVMLARDETLVSQAFDRIAPLVSDLRVKGQVRLPIRPVMRLIGEVLAARHRVIGTVQADERPDLLWDNPGLDRLYDRLEAEYELSERATALERKFEALGDFAEVLLDLVQDKRAFRLEAAIIGLIALELCLSLFKMVFP